MSARFRPIVLVAALVVITIGCSSGPKALGIKEDAKGKYAEGMDYLTSGNYLAASKIFQDLSQGPRYIKYTSLAKLRWGDTLFAEGRYLESIVIYSDFISQYGGDPNLPYAHFKIADAYYQELPGDWGGILPPAETKDQSTTKEAFVALKAFIETFPTSRFVPEAKKMLADCTDRLYKHEVFVVEYYASRNKPKAVLQRLEGMFDTFDASIAKTEHNLDLAIRSAMMLNLLTKAIDYYNEYVALYPKGKHIESLKALFTSVAGAGT